MKNGVTETALDANDLQENNEETFTPIFLLKSRMHPHVSAEKHKVKTTETSESDNDVKRWCSIL